MVCVKIWRTRKNLFDLSSLLMFSAGDSDVSVAFEIRDSKFLKSPVSQSAVSKNTRGLDILEIQSPFVSPNAQTEFFRFGNFGTNVRPTINSVEVVLQIWPVQRVIQFVSLASKLLHQCLILRVRGPEEVQWCLEPLTVVTIQQSDPIFFPCNTTERCQNNR